MTAKVNSHIVNFANVHFEDLRSSIITELYGKDIIDRISTATDIELKELKKEIGLPLYKLYTSELPFKLTCSQCRALKEQIGSVYIHKEVCENEFNSLLKMLKDILDVAIGVGESLEFNK